MCIATFIPCGSKSVYITSNRDESPSRPRATQPAVIERNGIKIHTPIDPQGGGSWIAVRSNGNIAWLLNGAFEKHDHLPPYRISRGIVLLDSLEYPDTKEFSAHYNFKGIEPFTLLTYNRFGNTWLSEIRWDGIKADRRIADHSKPHIWQSVTLYDAEARKNNEIKFVEWLKNNKALKRNDIIIYHKSLCRTGENRHEATTVSITDIKVEKSQFVMNYSEISH